MTKKKIFIDGDTGTTGLKIRYALEKRLESHQNIEILHIDEKYRKVLEKRQVFLNEADIAILCLPDEAAIEAVSLIENDSTAVIDTSTAHRVDPLWDYGFAEMLPTQRDKIINSKRISNPGCYPQGIIALLKPLIDEKLMPSDSELTINAVSGFSGGGRKMIDEYNLHGEKNSPFSPYGLNFEHKHLPEITKYSGLEKNPIFIPSVGNYERGMMVMIPIHYSLMNENIKGELVWKAISDRYAGEQFINVEKFESTFKNEKLTPKYSNPTNIINLHVFANDKKGQMLLVAVFDNLRKGASGSTMQNLNLMLKCEESLGLFTNHAEHRNTLEKEMKERSIEKFYYSRSNFRYPMRIDESKLSKSKHLVKKSSLENKGKKVKPYGKIYHHDRSCGSIAVSQH